LVKDDLNKLKFQYSKFRLLKIFTSSEPFVEPEPTAVILNAPVEKIEHKLKKNLLSSDEEQEGSINKEGPLNFCRPSNSTKFCQN
jgi:hypothetical protein